MKYQLYWKHFGVFLFNFNWPFDLNCKHYWIVLSAKNALLLQILTPLLNFHGTPLWKEIVSGTHSVIALNIEAHFFSLLSIWSNIYFSIDAEAYSGLSQTSKMELFADIRNCLNPLAIFLNRSISDVWLNSKCTSEVCLSCVILYKIDY